MVTLMPTEFPEDPFGTIVNLPLWPWTFTSTGTSVALATLPALVVVLSQAGKVALLKGAIVNHKKRGRIMVQVPVGTQG